MKAKKETEESKKKADKTTEEKVLTTLFYVRNIPTLYPETEIDDAPTEGNEPS